MLMLSCNTSDGLFQQMFNVESPGPLNTCNMYTAPVHYIFPDVDALGSVKCIFVDTSIRFAKNINVHFEDKITQFSASLGFIEYIQ